MAVYEHTYRPYSGSLTPGWSRFLIIPRHAIREVFQSRLFTGFFVLCFVCPLVMAILIYLRHNVAALALLELDVSQVLTIDSRFFRTFVYVQGILSFLIAVLVGPVLISRDLSDNALPLYLSRPFSRAEYVLGKLSVLLILMSAITWIPGGVLFMLQSYLEGGGWLLDNYWIAWAVFAASWTWMLVLALLSVAISAWVRWRIAASALIFGLFIVTNVFAVTINQLFRIRWGGVVSLSLLMQTVMDDLFRRWNSLNLPDWQVLPHGVAWVSLASICLICLGLLLRKVKAYEVVK